MGRRELEGFETRTPIVLGASRFIGQVKGFELADSEPRWRTTAIDIPGHQRERTRWNGQLDPLGFGLSDNKLRAAIRLERRVDQSHSQRPLFNLDRQTYNHVHIDRVARQVAEDDVGSV